MEAKNVTTLDENELYTGRIEFRSIGSGAAVQPHFFYSHHFPDNYEGEYPAAFLAMRDIAIMLQLQMRTILNSEVDLPEDPDELARVAIGAAEAETSTIN
jgi:hypothetical protein